MDPAVYLLNRYFVGGVIVATAPELCQNVIFPLKEDVRNFCLCSGIMLTFYHSFNVHKV